VTLGIDAVSITPAGLFTYVRMSGNGEGGIAKVSLYSIEGNGAGCRFPVVDNLTEAISSRVGELSRSGCGRYTGPDPDVYFFIGNTLCWRVVDDEITIGNSETD
jgi:hypothetical protein